MASCCQVQPLRAQQAKGRARMLDAGRRGPVLPPCACAPAPSCNAALLPATQWSRAAVGGALVGAGSSLATGCTMGHTVCGLARASGRSITFTVLALFTGIITATASGANMHCIALSIVVCWPC